MPAGAQRDDATPHVVVVGAGVIGVSVAYALQRSGARVTVVDRVGPASFTTGMAFAWIENQGFFRNGRDMDTKTAAHYANLHRLGFLAWRQLTAEIGPSLGVLWNGAVQFSPRGSDDADLLRQDLERRLRWGSTSAALSQDQICTVIPGINLDEDVDAFASFDEGHVDPAVFCSVLLRHFEELGGVTRYGVEAFGVEQRGDAVSALQTSEGSIPCDHVVYALGVAAPHLLADTDIEVPLEPSQGVLVHSRPMAPALHPVLITSRLHILQRFDGRVVMARHYSGTPVSDPDGLDDSKLVQESIELLPQLTGLSVERVTIGERVVPGDGLPIIGHSQRITNLHSITTNSGITLGPCLGTLMAGEILTGTRNELLDPYRSTRFG